MTLSQQVIDRGRFCGTERVRSRVAATVGALLLAERGEAMAEARDFAAGGILVNDAVLRGPHDDGLGLAQRRRRLGAIAARERILDLADIVAQPRAPRFVDRGPARNLARCLLG